MASGNHRHVFTRWLRDPRHIGALSSSGPALARAMAKAADTAREGAVLELGPGTGPVTAALLDTGLEPDRLVPVERDWRLHAVLTKRFPQLQVLHGDAAQLEHLMSHVGIGKIACIVSSLPLLTLPPNVQESVFRESFHLMPDGDFIQFTYSPSAPLSRRRQQELGVQAERVASVWRNIPPATVWRFRREYEPLR